MVPINQNNNFVLLEQYNILLMRYIIFLCLVALMPAACKESSSEQAAEKYTENVKMVVHRGANRLAPENTLVAFQKAIDLGADYIEVDVAMSSDSILYCFHDKSLERTTNGTGLFAEQISDYIDTLDAGSWFSPEFSNARVTKLSEIVEMGGENVNYYFDIKHADLNILRDFIYNSQLVKRCFVWFQDHHTAREFIKSAPDVALKVNAANAYEADSMIKLYNPQIIECDVFSISTELKQICQKYEVKLMANLLRDSWWEYSKALQVGVDLVNIDHPDYFNSVRRNPDYEFTDYRLAAHRGGITEGIYDEYDPASIKAAVDSGYWMLEIDVRPTADKKIIVHHDNDLERIYGVDKNVSDLTMAELKELSAKKGGYAPLSFLELVELTQGKIRLMVDIKPKNPDEWFINEIKQILEKHNMLHETYFIRNDLREYFGDGKYGFRMHEAIEIKKRLEAGENIAAHYYLFDHGNVINAQAARWCQNNAIDVCASVNVGHYRMEEHSMGARRDIEYLKKAGVTMFQIDSPYDDYFNLTLLK